MIPPEAPGIGGTLRPKPGGPIHPFEITVMIRTPYGMDKSEIDDRGKLVKE